jgi:hypothetical protein
MDSTSENGKINLRSLRKLEHRIIILEISRKDYGRKLAD